MRKKEDDDKKRGGFPSILMGIVGLIVGFYLFLALTK